MCIIFSAVIFKTTDYFWTCCYCHGYGVMYLHPACPDCGRWGCFPWEWWPRQEIQARSNTPEPLVSMMATIDNITLEDVSTRERSILFAPGQLGKEIESVEPDASSHQNISNEASRESLYREGDKHPSSKAGNQEPIESGENLPDSVPVSPPWLWWRLRRQPASGMSRATEASSSSDKRAILNQGDAGPLAKLDETSDAMFSGSTTLLENGEIVSRTLLENSNISENRLAQQEQQWFHQNIQYIIGELLREWQGFRSHTHNHRHGESSDNDENGLPQNNQGFKDSRKRKQDPEADSQEATSGPSNITKRQRGLGEDSIEPPLACPFSKRDLHAYRDCTKFGFKRARDVKQHLKRNHRPELPEPIRLCLQKPSSRGPREKQWYEIFEILFPGHSPQPSSPYNDFEISQQPPAVAAALDEALHIPYQYLMTEGAGILLQEIQQDPIFSQEGGPGINDMRRALGRMFGQYLNQQLARPLGASNGSNETPEESLGSNPDTSQEGLGSGSERTNTLVPESPNHTLGNQTDMPHLSDHQNSFIGTGQATRNFTQHDTGILVSGNQDFEAVGEDMDTVAATNHEEPPPREFEELWGTYTDFVFEGDPSYS